MPISDGDVQIQYTEIAAALCVDENVCWYTKSDQQLTDADYALTYPRTSSSLMGTIEAAPANGAGLACAMRAMQLTQSTYA